MLERGDNAPTPAQVVALDPGKMRAREASSEVRELALTIARLCAVGYSCAFFVCTLRLKDRFEFLAKNQLGTPRERLVLLGILGSGVLVPALIALVVRLRGGSAATARLSRAARLSSPLALVGLLPALFSWQLGHSQPLCYLILLALMALLLRPAIEQSLLAAGWMRSTDVPVSVAAPGRRARVLPLAIVVFGAAGYAAYMSYFTILNHHLILTTAFDLGIYDNLMFNALKGHPFHSPVLFGPGNRNYLAGHAELGMLLFIPFYAIRPGTETLLIIQACAFGFAAVPLYLFAARNIPRPAAVLVSYAYLLFAPLHLPNFYDFHWLPIAIFFHFCLYYALAARRNVLLWLALCVLFSIREDVAVGTAVLGVFLIVATERFRTGLAMLVASTVWFVLIKFVIMPRLGSWWFDELYKGLFADGQKGYGSVVRTLLSNPTYVVSTLLTADKLTYALHMTAALAFLPLRRPMLWLLFLPGALFTVLTTEYSPTTQIGFQYTAHWIPYLFLAAVLSLTDLGSNAAGFSFAGDATPALARFDQHGRVRFIAGIATLMVCAVCHSYAFGAVLQREKIVGGFREVRFQMTPAERARYQALRQLADRIPRDASVAATEYMSPHVSTRMESYVPRQPLGKPDYILLSNREVHGDPRNRLADAFRQFPYVLVGTTLHEFYLFRLGQPDDATKSALLGLRLPQYDEAGTNAPPRPKRHGPPKH
jgi:uncharacterized membrane protein